MKLSWSHKLFLHLNKQVGARPVFDRLMHICGHELIYVLALIVFVWATTDLVQRDPGLLTQFIKLLMTAGVFSFVTSWCIAWLFPHERPIKEFPRIVQLVTPLSTWKSFPSDHTIAAFILAEMVIIIGVPLWFSILLIMLASLVAIGRVYIGVHYPRDILGGIVVASLFSFLSYWILATVTQPLYNMMMLFL